MDGYYIDITLIEEREREIIFQENIEFAPVTDCVTVEYGERRKRNS